MAAARLDEDELNLGVAKGMTVQKLDEDEEDTNAVDQETIVKASSVRKTKSQRHKASKLLEEVCLPVRFIPIIYGQFPETNISSEDRKEQAARFC